jgi:hypothetical protein
MNIVDEIHYCRERELVERAAADTAQVATAQTAHARLADRYADKAERLSEQAGELARIAPEPR